jgi:hypothetical protein
MKAVTVHSGIFLICAERMACLPLGSEAEFVDEIQAKVLRVSSLLFTVTYTALP